MALMSRGTSEWEGGSVNGIILTIDSEADKVTYQYDTNTLYYTGYDWDTLYLETTLLIREGKEYSQTIKAGETLALPEVPEGKELQWSSSDESIAVVKDGKIRQSSRERRLSRGSRSRVIMGSGCI